MSKLDTKGIVAMIIVLTFGIVLCSTVIGAIVTGRALTADASHTLAAISGALIGVLSAYIGEKVSKDG